MPIWSGCSRTPSGFAAAKIIRRILGLAHNIDFNSMETHFRRYAKNQFIATAMMLDAPSFRTIGAVTKAVQEVRDWQPDSGG